MSRRLHALILLLIVTFITFLLLWSNTAYSKSKCLTEEELKQIDYVISELPGCRLERVIKRTKAAVKAANDLLTPEERVAMRARYEITVIPKEKWWDKGNGATCAENPATPTFNGYICRLGNKKVSGKHLTQQKLIEACCGKWASRPEI